jgi:hypothetical protein
MSGFNRKWVIGKTIAAVEMNAFDDGKRGKAFDPLFIFTDGSSMRVVTQETETGEYGVEPVYYPRAASDPSHG